MSRPQLSATVVLPLVLGLLLLVPAPGSGRSIVDEGRRVFTWNCVIDAGLTYTRGPSVEAAGD